MKYHITTASGASHLNRVLPATVKSPTSNNNMKRYTVNVHYDAVVTVVVYAESEEQALRLAPDAAETISLDTADIDDINCCVTDEEEL